MTKWFGIILQRLQSKYRATNPSWNTSKIRFEFWRYQLCWWKHFSFSIDWWHLEFLVIFIINGKEAIIYHSSSKLMVPTRFTSYHSDTLLNGSLVSTCSLIVLRGKKILNVEKCNRYAFEWRWVKWTIYFYIHAFIYPLSLCLICAGIGLPGLIIWKGLCRYIEMHLIARWSTIQSQNLHLSFLPDVHRYVRCQCVPLIFTRCCIVSLSD